MSQLDNAVQVTATEYYAIVEKNDPNAMGEFMGQTGVDDDGKYKMYWKFEDVVYVTNNSLF